MQPVINAPEIATAREQQLFNGKNFHVFIYAAGKNKTPPYDPGGMEAEISDCEQGTVRKIFCQPAVRLYRMTGHPNP